MEALKLLIEQSGLKHKVIAARIGIDNTYLSAMLNGHRTMPEETRNKIVSICQKVLV